MCQSRSLDLVKLVAIMLGWRQLSGRYVSVLYETFCSSYGYM